MTSCPACLGDGVHDFRDSDAVIGETWTEKEIARALAQGMVYPLGVVECDECGGTGLVDDERAKDLAAGARAMVDQIVAKHRDTGL